MNAQTTTRRNDSGEDSGADLVDLLRRQHALLGELAPLAEKQRVLIEAGDNEALLELLARRQQIIDRFLAEQDDLSRLSSNIDAHAEKLPPSRREEVRRLVDEIGDGLNRIMTLDREDQEQLQVARTETKQQISSLTTGAAARNAYMNKAGTSNRFADQQG